MPEHMCGDLGERRLRDRRRLDRHHTSRVAGGYMYGTCHQQEGRHFQRTTHAYLRHESPDQQEGKWECARSSFISHGATQARRPPMRRVAALPRFFEEATPTRSSGTTPPAAQVRLRSRARARRAVRCRLRHPRDRSMPREVASAPHGHQGDAAAALALRACLPSVARALGLPSCLPDP